MQEAVATQKIEEMKKKPGFVEFKILNNVPQLDDLWFMVGSRCNLSCAHCYVASSPTNDTLQQITVEDIQPYLEEAKQFNVKNIYFTGGEPFINRDMPKMIEESLKYADVTVLTNATFPLTRFIPQLKELNDHSSHNLTFRVSLDHYEKEKHEAIRGKNNFTLTKENVKRLSEAGFKPIITSTAVVYEHNSLSPQEIEQKFKDVFKEEGVDVEVKLLPYNLEMGSNLGRIKQPTKHVFISEHCMTLPGITNEMFQCHNGRTLEKINGKMLVYPCPIIYDDRRFELATTLKESFKKVPLTHKACFDFCYKSGGKCTN